MIESQRGKKKQRQIIPQVTITGLCQFKTKRQVLYLAFPNVCQWPKKLCHPLLLFPAINKELGQK